MTANQRLISLIDANNFCVSCERVFQPDLIGKPVAVLSNNDDCIVSRSQEIKDLGVKMRVPAFQSKHLVKQQNIQLLSSNSSLYASLSARVLSIWKPSRPASKCNLSTKTFWISRIYTPALKTLWLTLKKSNRLYYAIRAFRSCWAGKVTSVLKRHNIAISMDVRGWALDNIFVERLRRNVKY
jgi:nucleotidyltransferase/DNA polymerase involved in DNA repair